MKMTKIYPILGAAAMLTALAACSDEQTLPVGEGKIFLSARVNSDVIVESRAEAEEELAASTQIWISSPEGVVRKFSAMSEIPASGVTLLSGQYTIQAWAGTAAYASFTDRWFEGEETVELTAGDRKAVEVTCKIANVVASVNYGETLDEVISDYTMTIGHRGGELTFEGRDERRGYYIMPDGTTSLDWTLTATSEGKQFTKTGTIENVQPAHEYRLNVIASNATEEIGGALITIEVDDTMIESEDEVVITTPPAITGYGFDINVPVAGESGSIGRKSVYVSASSALTEVKVSGLEGIADFDFVRATADVRAELAAKGILCEVTNVDGSDAQMMKIILEDTYTNTLENRDEPYVVTFSAKDRGNKVTTASLTLKVSEAPVITNPVTPDYTKVDYQTLEIEGQVAKDGVETVGFQYREQGTSEWLYAPGQAVSRAGFAKGDRYSATITGLNYDAIYEYRAVSGSVADPTEFTGADILTVATKPTPQLPNASMEEWSTVLENGKYPIIPVAEGGNRFWDCGNHGSITMNKNVTDKSSEKRHSGNYSAKLRSEFVGAGIIGKLAAGNICVGNYLRTDGTDGVFGFGREFNFDGLKPKALKLWIHYTPVAVTHTKGGTLQKGDMDMGHIFCALFDGLDPDTADGEAPFIVRTKASKAKYFDRNADWIMAYGEKILTEATAGSNMVQIEIPFEYKSDSRNPLYIAIVCTASKEGDYYTGGDGSTLYVDDFQLVY